MASIQDTKDTVGALCVPNVEDVDSPSACTVQIRARVSFQRERPATKQYISPVKRAGEKRHVAPLSNENGNILPIVMRVVSRSRILDVARWYNESRGNEREKVKGRYAIRDNQAR